MVVLLSATLLVATALASSVGSVAAARDRPQPAGAVPGELIVGYRAGNATRVASAVRHSGNTVQARLSHLNAMVIGLRPAAAAVAGLRTLSELESAAVIDYVEPNYLVRSFTVPNDPRFGVQWNLYNTGQSTGIPGADIDALTAWEHGTGSGPPVAVVDTGVDRGHPDLSGNIWHDPTEPVDGVDQDRDGYKDDENGVDFVQGDSSPDDESGHGTHVAGVIGAIGNNAIGVAGIEWRAQIMPVRFLDFAGLGDVADGARALDYAVDHGARVINASWGSYSYSTTLWRAVAHAADHNVVVVAAAGNDGSATGANGIYPAGYDLPNVISVASTNRWDGLSSFSNYGARTVDLGAPGEDIVSTLPYAIDHRGYDSMSGTSMAAPQVSGAAALYFAKHPGASAAEVRAALIATVTPLAALHAKTVSGGRLNLAAAVLRKPGGVDRTRPARFVLVRPRDDAHLSAHKVVLAWRPTNDPAGIARYTVFFDGEAIRTLRRKPAHAHVIRVARFEAHHGKHVWWVRAYDGAGNWRDSEHHHYHIVPSS